MRLQFRPSTEADYPAIVAFMGELGEPTSAQAFAAAQRKRRPELPFLRIMAIAEDGALLGFGVCGWDYTRHNGRFYLNVRVAAAHRRQGVGRALAERLAAWAKQEGATVVEGACSDRDEGTLTSAQRLGFAKDGHVLRSTCDMTEWSPDLHESALQAVLNRGMQITTLAEEIATDKDLQRFHAYCRDLERDVPGRAPLTPPFAVWREMIADDPHWDPSVTLIAKDGSRWAGLSWMDRQEDGSYYTHLTIVHPDYRGEGVGFGLKVASLQLAKGMGAPYLSTYNHTNNEPMLAINHRLGYRPVSGIIQLCREI